ncbi:HAD family hydrolase [Actinomycetes bacterium KLBMP 9797]
MLAIFDLDNTLLDRAVPFRRWATSFAARHGLDASEVAWLEARDGDGFTPRPEFLSAVRDRYGLRESVDALLTRFRDEIVALTEPDPRVPPVLDGLRAAGWRVAIATNGAADQQRAKIRRAGLDRHVDGVAVSEEVGASKPDRRMFEVAARRCGATLAGGAWMVGDCADRDIAGGQGVGLRTIWMRRGRQWNPLAPAPDAIVDDLDEVPPMIKASFT